MIHGIGTDIVSVERIRSALERFGDRFALRLLTDDEFVEFQHSPAPAHFLARRFAAKEAAAKALGTGFSRGLSLRDIGVGHDANGRPQLVYYARARDLLDEFSVGESHLSIADEQDHAVAFVTMLARIPHQADPNKAK